MKLGFVSAIVPDLPLHEVFELAAAIGYECVEVMCWPPGKSDRRYAGVTHIDVSSLDDDAVASVRELIDDTGVEISGLGYYPNLLSPDLEQAAHVREHLERIIRVAPMLGVRTVNTFIGRDWTRSVDDNWPRFLDTWRPIVRLAEEHGVRIGIENCPMLFSRDEWPGGKNMATSPAIWGRMFADIPSDHFGLNYDPSHMVFQQMDYLNPIRDFAGKLFHVHAKDVFVDRRKLNEVGVLALPSAYHDPKLPGLGDVAWGPFVSALCDAGYRGPVCVEVEDRAYEHSPEARKLALLQSHRFLRNFIADERDLP